MGEIETTDILFNKITSIIEQARQKVATAINLTMVYSYFEIGRYIVEDEQQGGQRAEYGKAVLKELSERLTERFSHGFSVENLKLIRKFFLTYQEKVNTVYPIGQIADMSDTEMKTAVYYDRYIKQKFEKPTVGILLCETANQTLVELTLSENANIYAAQYALYLPDKKLLQQKLKEWTEEFEIKNNKINKNKSR